MKKNERGVRIGGIRMLLVGDSDPLLSKLTTFLKILVGVLNPLIHSQLRIEFRLNYVRANLAKQIQLIILKLFIIKILKIYFSAFNICNYTDMY